MKNLLKLSLSPSVNLFIGAVTLCLLMYSYKFFVIYLFMGPPATLLMWLFHKDLIKTSKDSYRYNINYWIIYWILGFILSSLCWIANLIGYTRISFFPEEIEKSNV